MKDMFLKYIKYAFQHVIPNALSGRYRSEEPNYNDLINRYYPENRKINIGHMGVDRQNYSRDFGVVFYDYKKAAHKEILKRQGLLN